MAEEKRITYSVRYKEPFRWAIFRGERVEEGGFFSRRAAETYLEREYHHPPGADYTYKLDIEKKVLTIVDLDRGNRSVTNDMENVIVGIAEREGVTVQGLCGFGIAYKDSMGRWDGVKASPLEYGRAVAIRFYSLNEKDEESAVKSLLKKREARADDMGY